MMSVKKEMDTFLRHNSYQSGTHGQKRSISKTIEATGWSQLWDTQIARFRQVARYQSIRSVIEQRSCRKPWC
jgi:hypothetical protein